MSPQIGQKKDLKPAKRTLEFHILRGSSWTLAYRWVIRVLGLANVVILARLLTPTDFGIVTIAMIIVGVIEVFGQTGQALALIRHPAPTREHYDSAWTISVFLGLGLGLIIWTSAPFANIYFHEPRAELVIHVVAFKTIISGLENIGVVNFRRDLRFRANFLYNTIPSIVAFIVTLTSAVILRNYWALVVGILSQQVAAIALSYVMESFRPRVSLTKVREIWSFSIWTLIRNIGVNLNAQIDKFVIGGFSGAATMGRYEVATDIATTPTIEINAPMMTALFPIMATVQSDLGRRRELYLRVLYWSALICTSTSVGVALVTSDMVDLLLGHQWIDAKPLIPWLALSVGILALSSSVYSALDVVGQPRVSAQLQWTRLATLAVSISSTIYFVRTAQAVAITRFAVSVAITPTLLMALRSAYELQLRDFISTLWRPVVASVVMTIAVLGSNILIPFTGPLRLAIDIALGSATYAVSLLCMWSLVGAPEGPEAVVWKIFCRVISNMSSTSIGRVD
jgi:O-antigen/teichoic acid export membrane protein